MNNDWQWVMVGGGAYEAVDSNMAAFMAFQDELDEAWEGAARGVRHFRRNPPPASWWDEPSPFAASGCACVLCRHLRALADMKRPGPVDTPPAYPDPRTGADVIRQMCREMGWEGDHRRSCDAGEA